MFSATLRIEDDLGRYLRKAAEQGALSVNAFLTQLIEREREAQARRRLAADWAAYARDGAAQEVDYALEAQGELADALDRAAEKPIAFRAAEPVAPHRPGTRKTRRKAS